MNARQKLLPGIHFTSFSFYLIRPLTWYAPGSVWIGALLELVVLFIAGMRR